MPVRARMLRCSGDSDRLPRHLRVQQPRQETWYGVDSNGDGKLFAQESDATITGDTELKDVHGLFRIWFMWGFITALAPCAAAPILAIANCIHEMVGKLLGAVISCGIGCGG